MKPLLFISYSRADEAHVSRICGDLSLRNVPYWLDAKDIKAGDSISQKIEEGLSAATHFCLCLSKNSNKSAWVEREYRAALTRQLSDKALRIVPILIEDCMVPPLLADIRYADFSATYQTGLQSLLDAIGSPDAPKVSPAEIVPYGAFANHIEQREPLDTFLQASKLHERSSLDHDWAARLFALLEMDVRRCREELEYVLSLGSADIEIVSPTTSRFSHASRISVMLCEPIVIRSTYTMVVDDLVVPSISAASGFVEFLELLVSHRAAISQRKLFLLPKAWESTSESFPDGFWSGGYTNTDFVDRIAKARRR